MPGVVDVMLNSSVGEPTRSGGQSDFVARGRNSSGRKSSAASTANTMTFKIANNTAMRLPFIRRSFGDSRSVFRCFLQPFD
jgi:hypothetical protein